MSGYAPERDDAKPSMSGEIQNLMERLGMNLERLSKSISAIEMRAGAVLERVPPQPASTAPTSSVRQGATTDLGDSLVRRLEELDRSIAHLDNIHSRIAL